jgi:kynurenine formamidase
MEQVEMRTHTGTHVDAPLHFIPEGKTLDYLSIESFVGPGITLDVTPKDRAERVTVDDIEPFIDEIEKNDVVLLHTGWDWYHGRTPEYLFEFPHLTGEASELLAGLEPKAVGIDTPSVGGWYDEMPNHGPATDVHPADSHLPLLENDIIPIEELRNLDQVLDGAQSRRADFFFLSLPFKGTGDGSVRAFAFL